MFCKIERGWRGSFLLVLLLALLFGCGEGGVEEEVPRQTIRKSRILIGGSASVIPLARLLAHEFEKEHPDIEITFMPATHSKGGLSGVKEGDVDIGLLSRPLKEEEAELGLQYLHLAQDGIAFATNSNVKIKNLTSGQLIDIYAGRITNWKQLGGKDRSIHVLDRPEHTSPKIILRDKLFGSGLKITQEAIVLERPGQMNESFKLIEDSIGYTSLGEVISSDMDLNILEVDGILPTPDNVSKNIYPYSRPFGMAIKRIPKKEVMKFINFVYGDSGQRVIESNGYASILSHFVIATIPERSIIRQEERYRPLVAYLSKRLGTKVKIGLKHLSSYQQIVEEFMKGRVNAAFFGSFVYVLTQAKVGVEAIARPEKDDVSQYRGLIFVRKDSGIKDWRDLRGKSFAMIKATTAGELFPKIFFRRHGIQDLEGFLGPIHYVGSHDVSVLKVLNREIDAGAAKDLIFEKLAREDPRIREEMKILARSRPVPENALVVRKNIDFVCFNCHKAVIPRVTEGSTGRQYAVDLKKSLQAILMDLPQSPEGREVLKKFGADRFLITTDKDYQEVYRMVEELGIDLKAYDYKRG